MNLYFKSLEYKNKNGESFKIFMMKVDVFKKHVKIFGYKSKVT